MAKLKIKTPFSVAVSARISRWNVGVICQEIWDKGKHDSVDKLFDHILQKNVATKVMKWHLMQVSRTVISHVKCSYSDACVHLR